MPWKLLFAIATFLIAFVYVTPSTSGLLQVSLLSRWRSSLSSRHRSSRRATQGEKYENRLPCLLAPSSCNNEAEMWYAQVLPHSKLAWNVTLELKCLASNFAKMRFRWSPTFHFSTPTNIFGDKNFCPKKFSAKCLFWRSCAGLHASIECRSKIHCQTYRFQPSTTLGGGVKREKTVFFRSYGLKKLIPSPLQNTF